MSQVAVITDTDSSLPPSLASTYAIQQVPIGIHFDGQTLLSGIDVDDGSLFERIDREGRLPTTSAPPPAAFAHAYRTAFQNGADSIVCICVSSKISTTYNSALSACDEFPGRRISVIDSQSVSIAQGFIALAAAEAARQGAAHADVIARVNSYHGRVHLFGFLTTLKYLAMGGRVGKVAAGMATMLNIHPILTMRDGKLDLLEKVRTRKAAMNRLVDLVSDSVGSLPVEQVALLHVNNLPGADELKSRLNERISLPPHTITVEFTPGLSVHTGNGMVGIAVISSE